MTLSLKELHEQLTTPQGFVLVGEQETAIKVEPIEDPDPGWEWRLEVTSGHRAIVLELNHDDLAGLADGFFQVLRAADRMALARVAP